MVSVRSIPVTDLSQERHVEWSRALNTCGRCIVRDKGGALSQRSSCCNQDLKQYYHNNVNGRSSLTCTLILRYKTKNRGTHGGTLLTCPHPHLGYTLTEKKGTA